MSHIAMQYHALLPHSWHYKSNQQVLFRGTELVNASLASLLCTQNFICSAILQTLSEPLLSFLHSSAGSLFGNMIG